MSVVTAAARRRSSAIVLALLVAATLTGSACSASSGQDGSQTAAEGGRGTPPEPPSPTSPPEPSATVGERVGPPEPDVPVPPDDETGSEPPTGPPDPSTPRIIDGECVDVRDEATEAIESGLMPEAEARALRAFATLCLREDATNDLVFARENADDLTPETRELLGAVVAADEPEGDELLDVLREGTRP